MTARAVPRMPAPTIKTSDSWWSIRRRDVSDVLGYSMIVGEAEEEIEVGGLTVDGEGWSWTKGISRI